MTYSGKEENVKRGIPDGTDTRGLWVRRLTGDQRLWSQCSLTFGGWCYRVKWGGRPKSKRMWEDGCTFWSNWQLEDKGKNSHYYVWIFFFLHAKTIIVSEYNLKGSFKWILQSDKPFKKNTGCTNESALQNNGKHFRSHTCMPLLKTMQLVYIKWPNDS